jgi:hypothetical protein
MALEFETSVVYECRGEASARVYLVAAPTTDVDRETLAKFRISGNVVGPNCHYSSTLQAKIPLAHRGLTMWGDRPAITAEAIVPDPCYWSTELPFLYRAIGRIDVGEADKFEVDQTFGMRDLSVVRNRLVFNGKVWVPRIVLQSEVPADTPLEAWRETDTVMFASKPTDESLRAASQLGVAVVMPHANGGSIGIADLRRMSRFPCVAIVKTEEQNSIEAVWRSAAPNLLLARWYDERAVAANGDETDLFFVPVYEDGRPFEGHMKEWPASFRRPLIPVLPLPRTMPPAEARGACDQLQRIMVGKYDASGYAV